MRKVGLFLTLVGWLVTVASIVSWRPQSFLWRRSNKNAAARQSPTAWLRTRSALADAHARLSAVLKADHYLRKPLDLAFSALSSGQLGM